MILHSRWLNIACVFSLLSQLEKYVSQLHPSITILKRTPVR